MREKGFVEKLILTLQLQKYTAHECTYGGRELLEYAESVYKKPELNQLMTQYLEVLADYEASIDAVMQETIKYGKNSN